MRQTKKLFNFSFLLQRLVAKNLFSLVLSHWWAICSWLFCFPWRESSCQLLPYPVLIFPYSCEEKEIKKKKRKKVRNAFFLPGSKPLQGTCSGWSTTLGETDSVSPSVVACIFSVTELCTCGDEEIEQSQRGEITSYFTLFQDVGLRMHLIAEAIATAFISISACKVKCLNRWLAAGPARTVAQTYCLCWGSSRVAEAHLYL